MRATSRCSSAERSGVRGWARGIPACANARPSRARSTAANAGEAVASGCAVEQMSCRNPGSVTSSVRNPPPGWDAASRTSTRQPTCARATAANSPFGPDPTTTASTSCPMGPHLRGRPYADALGCDPVDIGRWLTHPRRTDVRSGSVLVRVGAWL